MTITANITQRQPLIEEEAKFGDDLCDPDDYDATNVLAHLHLEPFSLECESNLSSSQPLQDTCSQPLQDTTSHPLQGKSSQPLQKATGSESLQKDTRPILSLSNGFKRFTKPLKNASKWTTSIVLKMNSLLDVQLDVYSMSVDTAMVSLTLSLDEWIQDCLVEPLHLHMSNTVSNPKSQLLPTRIVKNDKYVYLYHLLILHDAKSLLPLDLSQGDNQNLSAPSKEKVFAQRILYFSLKATPQLSGLDQQTLNLRYYAHVSLAPDGRIQNKNNVLMIYGRRFEESVTKRQEALVEHKGLSISFSGLLNLSSDATH